MGPLRLDENSTESTLNEVFNMQAGGVFGIAPEFLNTFIQLIPRDKFFKFSPINKDSMEYKKYGSNCYKILCNQKMQII